jgi:hypothetical protein
MTTSKTEYLGFAPKDCKPVIPALRSLRQGHGKFDGQSGPLAETLFQKKIFRKLFNKRTLSLKHGKLVNWLRKRVK